MLVTSSKILNFRKMNREIKFRVWCPTSKHFSTQPWLSCDGLMLKWEHTGDIQTLTDIRFDNYVIQQYTGIKDKNAKEIYEGDILKLNELNYEVMYVDGQYIATCPYYNKHHWPKFEHFAREARCSEVVGNIFENPELLEK